MPPSTLQSEAPPVVQKVGSSFEFTKRKRWADLLITELVNSVIFVLSPSCKILFCGTAITELLGWRDFELIDIDLGELVIAEDQLNFRESFNRSTQTGDEITTHVRIRSNEAMALYTSLPKDILFEMKIYPHVVPESNHQGDLCYFAMSAPYPSRNTNLLNTVLDLKARNGRLTNSVKHAKSLLPPGSTSSTQPSTSQSNPMYVTSSLHPTRAIGSGTAAPRNPDTSSSYLAHISLAPGPLDDPPAIQRDALGYGTGSFFSTSSIAEETSEEGSKKKKLKRAQNTGQYVCITCGRTESPEWRKGPLGPKTLCNACGLRWAKQHRKADEPKDGTNITASAET